MEQLPEDPVTKAIEDVTRTLADLPETPGREAKSSEGVANATPVNLRTLSSAVNAEARRRHSKTRVPLGINRRLGNVAARIALRYETPYPYSFIEDDHMFPSGNETFGRVIRRGRKEGLEEIHQTIGEQEQEHSWLFIEGAGIWIDTTVSADTFTVDPDRHAPIFLSHLYPHLEEVHTHPDRAVRSLAQTEPYSFSRHYLLEAARPSTNDLIGHYQMSARTAPGTWYVSSIVSHHGVTSFNLLEQPGKLQGISTSSYEWLVTDASDPVTAIRGLLDRMSANVTTLDKDPALSVRFQPLPHVKNS